MKNFLSFEHTSFSPILLEFLGMDILKHGESAYPADAWVEQQYMKDGAGTMGLVRELIIFFIFYSSIGFPHKKDNKIVGEIILRLTTSFPYIFFRTLPRYLKFPSLRFEK